MKSMPRVSSRVLRARAGTRDLYLSRGEARRWWPGPGRWARGSDYVTHRRCQVNREGRRKNGTASSSIPNGRWHSRCQNDLWTKTELPDRARSPIARACAVCRPLGNEEVWERWFSIITGKFHAATGISSVLHSVVRLACRFFEGCSKNNLVNRSSLNRALHVSFESCILFFGSLACDTYSWVITRTQRWKVRPNFLVDSLMAKIGDVGNNGWLTSW